MRTLFFEARRKFEEDAKIKRFRTKKVRLRRW